MDDREQILDQWQAQLAAMDAGDPDALRDCFAPGAVLVHMTGYRQPLEEWVRGVANREFVYHRLEERSVAVTVDGDRATLVGHITTGITDDGSGHAWPLRCEQDYRRTADGWECTTSRVTHD